MIGNKNISQLTKAALDKLHEFNRLGTEGLSKGNLKDAMKFLKMAEKLVHASRNVLSDEYPKMFSLTMNNLGCYYKK